MRPLFVGEAPGRLGDPRSPLSGRIGRRLAALSGLTDGEFVRRTRRVNLLRRWPGSAGKGSKFPVPSATRAAAALLSECWRGQVIVLLGLRVAAAFGMQAEGYLKWGTIGRVRCIVIPHPSGINRWYNGSRNRAKLRRFLVELFESNGAGPVK